MEITKGRSQAFGLKHNNLFRPGPAMRLNACVGRNGGPAGLDRYAAGYFEAGKRILKSLQDDPMGVDLLVYPLVHLYRHGIEAILKHLAKLLPVLCNDTGELKLTHKLIDNWKAVRKFLKRLDVDEEELKSVDQLLADFVDVDPNGVTFRYPQAMDGRLHLQDVSIINVEVFCEKVQYLAHFLEGTSWWAEELWQLECEMRSEQARDGYEEY